jgi:hypothetical protein
MHCDQCEFLFINGIGCHETGCPNQGAIQCAGCSEPVRKHAIFYANDWDGIEYCKACAEHQAEFEASQDTEEFDTELEDV